MSQIWRLCYGHVCKFSQNAKCTNVPPTLESQWFEGCNNCRLLRRSIRSQGQGPHLIPRRVSFASASQPQHSGVPVSSVTGNLKSLSFDEVRAIERRNKSRLSELHSKGIQSDKLTENPFIYQNFESWDIQLKKFKKQFEIGTCEDLNEKTTITDSLSTVRNVIQNNPSSDLSPKIEQKHVQNLTTVTAESDVKYKDTFISKSSAIKYNVNKVKHKRHRSGTRVSFYNRNTEATSDNINIEKCDLEENVGSVHSELFNESSRAVLSPGSVDAELSEESLEAHEHELFEPVINDEKVESYISKTDVHDKNVHTSNDMHQNVQESAKQLKLKRVSEVDIEKKKEFFNSDFMSFVEACLFSNQANAAFKALRYYRYKKGRHPEYEITDVAIYSKLMSHYARIGDISKITVIFSWLKEQNKLKPSLQCYSAFLEYLGRQTEIDKEKGEEILTEIELQGYDIRNIFKECDMMEDERKYVHKVLSQLIENFEPIPWEEPQGYNIPLLKPLNNPIESFQPKEKNPYSGIITPGHLNVMTELQMNVESSDHMYVKSIERKRPLTERDLEKKKELETLKKNWRKDLLKTFNRKVKDMERREKGCDGMKLSPYFKLFEPEEYIDILMSEIEHLCLGSGYYSPTASYLWNIFGKKVHRRFLIKFKEQNGVTDQILKVYRDFAESYTDPNFEYRSHRECWLDLLKKHADGPSIDVQFKDWSNSLLKTIGKKFYDMIILDLKLEIREDGGAKKRLIPAFYYVYRSHRKKIEKELKPHPVLLKLYSGNYITQLSFDISELPMLVPPIPWYSSHKGGYLLKQPDFIRLPDNVPHAEVEPVESGKINGVFDALNILDMCPWTINKPMLEVVIDLFNNKGDKNLDIPLPQSEFPAPPQITVDMTVEQKIEAQEKRRRLKQDKTEMYSLWCNELYKLSIANKYKDEVFWFPHNLDFRGRTYPVPPHFNHLGGDVTRSILLFAKGKPLGQNGLDWLKIHLVNLTGFKKRSSNRERLAYADEMMDEIMDSADNPMNGNKWWQTSDEPWQTLACCKEIANAVRSPNPGEYICQLPVHQDGSCNGLQHYAALGLDQAGAESVNLCPFDAPKDVYSNVAELVEEIRKQDAGDKEIAQILEGFVRRKVIKQTVMTTVYGVTGYGARRQILRQLKDIPEFPEEHQWEASCYLTDATFKSLQKMFTSTKAIQDWFTHCANLISHVCHQPVEWVTPLGLSVLQPYYKMKSLSMKGMKSSYFSVKPNAVKQKNGFPPNFIHSLDSVHMMLTALYCYRAGITYVSVHDCYWTHPCDVEIMNKICREQFIALHSEPILEDLSKFMCEKFGDLPDTDIKRKELKKVLSNVPEKGKFDLSNVRNSTYFFS